MGECAFVCAGMQVKKMITLPGRRHAAPPINSKPEIEKYSPLIIQAGKVPLIYMRVPQLKK